MGGSVELHLEQVLALLVKIKLWQLGFAMDDQRIHRGNVLLTDSTGVDVPICGCVPEPSRFPLKMHFESNTFSPRDLDDDDHPLFESIGQLKRRESTDLRHKLERKARTFGRSTSAFAHGLLNFTKHSASFESTGNTLLGR